MVKRADRWLASLRPMPGFQSPLRYPGGKRKLANFVKLVLRKNGLMDGEYAEVYAGGAAVALELLFERYVSQVHINDFDPGVYAFWNAAVHRTAELCERVRAVPVTMGEWHRQRAVFEALRDGEAVDPLDAALATFFLNRTNRSGIISGGVIGGKDQTGEWKIDARFNKDALIRRIQKVGRDRTRIRVTNLDGADFLRSVCPTLPACSLVYLDPPYFVKGQQLLYANYYRPEDHAVIADLVDTLDVPWLVSYDDVEEIRALYARYRSRDYDLYYSLQDRYEGQEVAFFAPGMVIPDVPDPGRIKSQRFRQLELDGMG